MSDKQSITLASLRAASAWTEVVTNVREAGVPDAVYEKVQMQLPEVGLADLALAIATINAWNRRAIAARTVPGSYQPAKTHTERGREEDHSYEKLERP